MRKTLTIALFLLLSLAVAHSKVIKIIPAKGASVSAPKTIEITFNEAIESQFSTFKVYAYTGELSNGALRTFVKSKITLKNDATARADSSTQAKGTTKNVQISLKPKLKTGTYVVMWRILGSDTHTVDGSSFFKIKP
jgi:copper resistance protein C